MNTKVSTKFLLAGLAVKTVCNTSDQWSKTVSPDRPQGSLAISQPNRLYLDGHTRWMTTARTELLQTNGASRMAQIPGTKLLYATNTDNDIFLDVTSQHYYALLAGRWYTAPSTSPTAAVQAAVAVSRQVAAFGEEEARAAVDAGK
jgi:hypothetical protein